jgi:hypothetical protein
MKGAGASLLISPAMRQSLSVDNAEWAPVSYEPVFKTSPVRIIDACNVGAAHAPTLLARLENKKLVMMARDRSGKMRPFHVRAIETGFYDTRNRDHVDWNEVFDNYRRMGANTSMFMIHWQDIEQREGHYSFDFMDSIVDAAKKHDVRIWWVLFMRDNTGHPVAGANAWIYRFLRRDGADYSIQWIKTKDGTLLNNADAYVQANTRIYPAYGHPEVFPRILNMLRVLGRHYRDSPDVVGVQIGNEEGFNNAGEGDFNPATIALFEQWKEKTNEVDENLFKMEINKFWWKHFTTAFHEEDPFKLTSYNLLGGGPEAGNASLITRMGVDSSIYRDGNLDVIGTMFYHKDGQKIWPNLDREYGSCAYRLPVLMPSEIGLGPKWGPRVQFQEYAINAMERGSQGYSAYCYGELTELDGSLNAFGQAYEKFTAMVRANQDLIYEGVPGPGDVSIETQTPEAKVSQLHRDQSGTLGILHFPHAYLQENPDANTETADVRIELKTTKSGRYKLETYQNGALQNSEVKQLEAGWTGAGLTFPGFPKTGAMFLKVVRMS